MPPVCPALSQSTSGFIRPSYSQVCRQEEWNGGGSKRKKINGHKRGRAEGLKEREKRKEMPEGPEELHLVAITGPPRTQGGAERSVPASRTVAGGLRPSPDPKLPSRSQAVGWQVRTAVSRMPLLFQQRHPASRRPLTCLLSGLSRCLEVCVSSGPSSSCFVVFHLVF